MYSGETSIILERLKRKLYPGINLRVTGPFLLIIIIIASIGVYIVTRLVAGSLQERFDNQLIDSARAASNSIADIEREQLATLRLMVFTDGVSGAITTRNTEDLDLWLRPVAANAGLDDVIVFDAAGQGVLHMTRILGSGGEYSAPVPPDVSGWPGVQAVINSHGDTANWDKFIDIRGASPDALFYISAPVVDADDQLVGGISVGLRTDRLAAQCSAQALSAVVLYDMNGVVLGNTFRSVALDVLTLSPDRARVLAGEVEDASPIEEITLNGVPYHVMYTAFDLRSQPVGLMAVGLPTNFIVERIGTSRDTFAVMFAGLFIVVGAFGLFTARSITQPVRRLVDTTRAIRAGDLTQRVGLDRPDELGELAVSFDHMTGQLIARNAEIENLYLQQLEETALREAVLINIGDAVFMQNPDGQFILHNERAAQLLDRLRGDPAARRAFNSLTRTPESLQHPRTVALCDAFFSVIATPVRLPEGQPLGHVIVLRDITALVQSEKLKDDLILSMSHELRTPLTAARGYVDLVKMLAGKALNRQSHEHVQGALDHLTILERMINQVIDVSEIISNRFTIHVDSLNLAELLEERIAVWNMPARRRQQNLTLMLPSDEMWIEGDRERLTQVIDHLLQNASNYTLPGGEIEVYAALKNGSANVYIADNGVGIPSQEITKVFERMYRGSSANAGPTDARGLGLGLYFSKHIVEAHRGTISLESKVDYGTVVTIELPVRHNV